MARVAAVVSDLMLASRVKGSLEAAGHEVSVTPTLPQPVEADVIVCDLDAADADAVASADVPSLGFYSHVEVDTKTRAQKAGIDLVVPRSRMARELPRLVESLL